MSVQLSAFTPCFSRPIGALPTLDFSKARPEADWIVYHLADGSVKTGRGFA